MSDQIESFTVDEIAYFVLAFAQSNSQQAKNFFYQLRSLQLGNPNVSWLLTGSIGLNIVAEMYDLGGAFVDFETYILEPYTDEQAKSFVRDETIQATFNHRFRASDADFEFMFKELGWLAPYYLRLVANEVQPSGVAQDGVLTATQNDIEAAFKKLLGPSRKGDFAVWKEHIDKNLPKRSRELARKILGSLSKDADGESFETLHSAAPKSKPGELRDVLSILESDGLIQKVEQRYRFRSGLIRRYWQEYEAQ